jgi:hypothetical protein
MGSKKTAWHVLFSWLLGERAAPGIEVRSEIPLGAEPQRIDYLLLRRTDDDLGTIPRECVLRGLWPRLGRETIAEFKSVSRPFAQRDLERLLGYGLQWYVARPQHLATHADLTLALMVASRTRTLLRSVAAIGWRWIELGGGYSSLEGGPFRTFVAELDSVSDAEQDELLGAFGHRPVTTPLARRWLTMHTGRHEGTMRLDEFEDFDEVLRKFVTTLSPRERLAGLAPEERLAGLAPEERLAGLAVDDLVLALPDEVLRALRPEFVAQLPDATREAIRKRLRG